MKRLALLSLCLMGCASDLTARQSVIDTLKTTEVQVIPTATIFYLARTSDGAVWLVETSLLTGKYTNKTLMFAATQPEAK